MKVSRGRIGALIMSINEQLDDTWEEKSGVVGGWKQEGVFQRCRGGVRGQSSCLTFFRLIDIVMWNESCMLCFEMVDG